VCARGWACLCDAMCYGEVSVLFLGPGITGGILLRDCLWGVRVGCRGVGGLLASGIILSCGAWFVSVVMRVELVQ
jgi:hypothetical protein